MGKDTLSKIRANDVWRSIERTLKEYRISDYQVVDKRPHPCVKFNYCGIDATFEFAGTPGSRYSPREADGKLRRRLKELQMESLTPSRQTSLPTPSVSFAEDVVSLLFEGSEVRIRDSGGQPWFVLADVCRALGLSNPTMVAQPLDDDEKAKIGLRGGEATVINESGLYAIIMRTRSAMQQGTVEHRFRKWVTSDVLPKVRKGGAIDLPALILRLDALEKRQPAPLSTTEADLSDTVTASKIIELAGVTERYSKRAAVSAVTLRMKDFCLIRGYRAIRLPQDIDSSRRWRFSRQAANEWLASDGGAAAIRALVTRQQTSAGRALAVISGGA